MNETDSAGFGEYSRPRHKYSVKSICPQCKQEWSRDYTEHQLYHLSGGMLALEVCNECTVLDEHGDPIVTVELTKRYDCDKN